MALCLVKHRDNFTFMQETINWMLIIVKYR
jgi:hypothetical protein